MIKKYLNLSLCPVFTYVVLKYLNVNKVLVWCWSFAFFNGCISPILSASDANAREGSKVLWGPWSWLFCMCYTTTRSLSITSTRVKCQTFKISIAKIINVSITSYLLLHLSSCFYIYFFQTLPTSYILVYDIWSSNASFFLMLLHNLGLVLGSQEIFPATSLII